MPVEPSVDTPANALDGLIDLQRYPLDDLDGDTGRALIDRCRRQLADDGCVVLKNFVPDEALERLERETERLSPRPTTTRPRPIPTTATPTPPGRPAIR